MLYAKYRLSDNQFLCVWSQRPDFDPVAEAIQAYPEALRPNIRTERFDATAPDKKRAATAQELADFDDARMTAAAQRFIDADPMFLAMGALILQEINLVRADVRANLQSQTPILDRTQAQIIARFKTIYKAVLTQLNL